MLPGFRIFLIGLVILVSGCATNIPVETVSDTQRELLWEKQQAANLNLSSWGIKGKIGIKIGEKGGSATLNWSYLADNQKIEIYGPFGSGRVHISTTNDSAILKDTKGRVIKGESADDVLYQKLGWHVPFTELVMWSRGLPNEGATEIEIDSAGRLKSLNQGYWHVEYQEYRVTNELTLPRKLTITSIPGALELYDDDGKYIGDKLSVKVILKHWRDIVTG